MADSFPAFDLNVRLEDDDGNLPFDLNEPVLEEHNNNGTVSVLLGLLFPFMIFTAAACLSISFLSLFFSFSTGFDLNLPLDEFGAVDFDYVQNLTGNFFSVCSFLFLIISNVSRG